MDDTQDKTYNGATVAKINPLNTELNPHLPSAGIIRSSPYTPH